MQTFLPYPDFSRSVRSLDRARLGKQRVECYQLLRVLTGATRGWGNHPAARMWRNHEGALFYYLLAVCDEWSLVRGYQDSVRDKAIAVMEGWSFDATMPDWLGREDVHRSHRANLVKKFPEHYVPQFGNLEWEDYVWPV